MTSSGVSRCVTAKLRPCSTAFWWASDVQMRARHLSCKQTRSTFAFTASKAFPVCAQLQLAKELKEVFLKMYKQQLAILGRSTRGASCCLINRATAEPRVTLGQQLNMYNLHKVRHVVGLATSRACSRQHATVDHNALSPNWHCMTEIERKKKKRNLKSATKQQTTWKCAQGVRGGVKGISAVMP